MKPHNKYGQEFRDLFGESHYMTGRNPVAGDCGCNGSSGKLKRRPYPSAYNRQRLVALKPDMGQGYVVMGRKSNPRIRNWRISVINRMQGSRDYMDQVVQTLTLPPGTNYWKVPLEYRKTNEMLLLAVEGLGNSGQPVDKEPPFLISKPVPPGVFDVFGGSDWSPYCDWVCDGVGYAWELAVYRHDYFNQFYMALQSAYSYFDEDEQIGYPFYSYMGFNQFYSLGLQVDHINTIGPLESPINNPFTTDQGGAISGPVFGVAKDLGPWENLPYSSRITPIINNNPCAISYEQAIQLFNSSVNLPLNPPLECTPAHPSASPLAPESGIDDISNSNCFETVDYNPCLGDEEDGCGIEEYLNNLWICLTGDGGLPIFWDFIDINKIGGPDNGPTTINLANITQTRGRLDIKNTAVGQLGAGLYVLGIISNKNKTYIPKIFEVKKI